MYNLYYPDGIIPIQEVAHFPTSIFLNYYKTRIAFNIFRSPVLKNGLPVIQIGLQG